MKNKQTTFSNSALAACILLSLTIAACQPVNKAGKSPGLFISSYSDSVDKGLALFSLDPDSLTAEALQILGGQPSPNYFEFHPSGKYFYMVSTKPVEPGGNGGSLNAYTLDDLSGKMEFINAANTHGVNPCHVSLDRTGRYLFVSHYGSGSLSVHPILENGRVGDSIRFFQYSGGSVNPDRQEGPHAHSSLISHDNEILYVADLGRDKVMVYEFDVSKGTLNPALNPWISTSEGAGPRYMALHPELDILYVAEEMSSSVSVFNTGRIREEGASAVQRVTTLPPEFKETNTVADIYISPDGKFLYVSNRGQNSIAVFRTDPENGTLTRIGHQSTYGNWPRSFSFSPDASLLLVGNQRTNNITVFRRDPETGMFDEMGPEIPMADPKIIQFYR